MPDAHAASCLAKYASRGPCYTSDPSATEFGPVPLDQVQREPASLPGMRRAAPQDAPRSSSTI